MAYYIGIDNAKKTHMAAIVDEIGNKVNSFSFNNDMYGFDQLYSEIKKYKSISVSLEMTFGPLVIFLLEKNLKMYQQLLI